MVDGSWFMVGIARCRSRFLCGWLIVIGCPLTAESCRLIAAKLRQDSLARARVSFAVGMQMTAR